MNFYLTTPTSVMEARRRMMRRMFDETAEEEPTFSIPMNLSSNQDDYTIKAFIPGLPSDAVNIQFNNGILTIDGEYPEVQLEDQDVHLSELPVGKFSRSIEFTNPVAADKIEANLKDGVLTLRIPKAEEAKPKTIKISTK
ncbi:MAG: heat-shock protein Hsp20 [Chloroflexi bacterium HGW-Chloroflexi-4]|jgi:HSP20 family protein|nr:MAG: heat-shock protein Hsp20 [Chloroflexi bacterium HGW-Chloroflexi-4]